jgi:hypothetical protein
MNKQLNIRRAALLPPLAALLVAVATASPSLADGTSAAAGAGNGASLLGGALPGGAVISARYAMVTPTSGGPAVSTPIAGDGSFSFSGLAPGPYRLSLASSSVPKQTQGATFGEKVNAGLHAAGSAVSQGAKSTTAKHDTAMNSVGNVRGREAAPSSATASDASTTAEASQKGINGINGGMPNRISMNVTIARQSRTVDVDGAPIDVAVAGDGSLAGRVAASP